MSKNSVSRVKCPWCGREVCFKKGRIERHVQSTKLQCVGGGQPEHQVRGMLNVKLRDEVAPRGK